MIRQNRLILVLLLACILPTFGNQTETETLRLISPKVFKPAGASSSVRTMVCRYEEGDFWLLHNSVEVNDPPNVCSFRMENLSTHEEIELEYPCDSLYRPHIIDYFVTGDRIILVDVVSVIVFRSTGPNKAEFTKVVSLPATVLHCERVDEVLNFWSDLCTGHKLENSCFYTFSLNLEDSSIIDIYEFTHPYGEARMFGQPRKVIDRIDDVVLISDVARYKLYFVTGDGLKIDSIIHEPDDWIYADSEVDMQPGIQKQTYFPIIDSLLKNTSSIRRVELISTNSVLVLWDNPTETGQFDKRADVWLRRNGEWSLVHQTRNFLNETQLQSKVFSLKTSPLQNAFTYDDGFIIEIIAAPPVDDAEKEWDSFVDYQNASDKFYLDNPLQYIVLVREFDYE